ncbi:MAG: hypothetical protein ACRD9S_15835 [Pyrinomonadaceae bacterium]
MAVGLLEVQAANVPMSIFTTVGLVEESATDRLQTSFAEIARRIFKELDEIATQAVKLPNAEEFIEQRKKLYPTFLKLSKAISDIVLAKMDEFDLPSLTEASFDALEAEIRSIGSLYFSSEVQSEILFSVSTLKSAYMAVPRLYAIKLDEAFRDEDRKLGEDFTVMATWSQFHLEGLRSAFRKNLTISPDVQSLLVEGLRASVMAYSYARQGLDLRGALDARYENDFDITWDEEDEALAKAD